MAEKTLSELRSERAALDRLIANYPMSKPGSQFEPGRGVGLQRERFEMLSPVEKVAHVLAGGTVFD